MPKVNFPLNAEAPPVETLGSSSITPLLFSGKNATGLATCFDNGAVVPVHAVPSHS